MSDTVSSKRYIDTQIVSIQTRLDLDVITPQAAVLECQVLLEKTECTLTQQDALQKILRQALSRYSTPSV
jgi:hypothetical protein